MTSVAELLQAKPRGEVYVETFDVDVGRWNEFTDWPTFPIVENGYAVLGNTSVVGTFDLFVGGSIAIEVTNYNPSNTFLTFIFRPGGIAGADIARFQVDRGLGILSFNDTLTEQSVPFSLVDHRWLRFFYDRAESTMAWQASPDGNEWTTLRSQPVDDMLDYDQVYCRIRHTGTGGSSVRLQTASIVPTRLVGISTGMGDWRVAVEMLLPTDPTSRWGIAVWGESKWSGLEWYDLTEFVRGAEWSRGTTGFAGRPEAGVLDVTLANDDRQFSPWNGVSAWNDATVVDEDGIVQAGYFAPGSIVRVMAYSPSGQSTPLSDPAAVNLNDSFAPQFTGVVESWVDETIGAGADSFVNVTVVETISKLAQVDDNALQFVVGNDDQPAARIQRLIDTDGHDIHAGWVYGEVINDFQIDPFLTAADYRLQSTNMANNRITELYLTADSVGGVVRSDRSGTLIIYNNPETTTTSSPIRNGPEKAKLVALGPDYEEGLSGFFQAPYVVDSVKVANDDESIINDVRLAYSGGSQRSGFDSLSDQQYGNRPYVRNDLICKENVLLDHLIDKTLAARANNPLRLASLQLHSAHEGTLPAIISLDVHDIIDVVLPPLPDHQVLATGNTIDGITHRLTPLNGSEPTWTVDVVFGIQSGITSTPIL